GPFVSDEEVERVVTFMETQGAPDYIDEVTEEQAVVTGTPGSDRGDELYDEAVQLVAREGKASTSFIQRHLQIGYNRAARIIEQMEGEGIVSAANRVGRREILIGGHGA
ncbi:MAG: DNA translocase FtsK, partial [Rhodospirillales bacterium]